MKDKERHKLELEAALKQIQDIHKKQSKVQRGWYIDKSLPIVALQGIGVLIVGFLVGLGLYVLINVIFLG